MQRTYRLASGRCIMDSVKQREFSSPSHMNWRRSMYYCFSRQLLGKLGLPSISHTHSINEWLHWSETIFLKKSTKSSLQLLERVENKKTLDTKLVKIIQRSKLKSWLELSQLYVTLLSHLEIAFLQRLQWLTSATFDLW